MAKLNVKCMCGVAVTAHVGDSFRDGRLRWYLSYICSFCGSTVESDGIDELPQDIKNAIISQNGKYALILHDIKELSKVIYILKKQFTYNFENHNHLQADSEIELIDGTENEIYFIYSILTKMKIENVEIRKI